MRVNRLAVAEALSRLGPAGVIGSLLLVLAGLSLPFVIAPAREYAAAQDDRIAQARARLARLQSGEEAQAPETPASRVYRALPMQQEATAAIDRIYAAAEQERIPITRGEYSLVIEPAPGLAQYQILLPVHGTYPQIRRFVATALDAVPALGLEDIALQRKKIGDASVDARLRMTLYLTRRP